MYYFVGEGDDDEHNGDPISCYCLSLDHSTMVMPLLSLLKATTAASSDSNSPIKSVNQRKNLVNGGDLVEAWMLTLLGPVAGYADIS